MIKLSPHQVQAVVGISRDTLRHWRSILPPIQGRSGYSACFSAGEALALIVVNVLVKEFQVSVGALAPFANQLFDICGTGNWHQLRESSVVVEIGAKRVSVQRSKGLQLEQGPAIVLPLLGIIEHLQGELLGSKKSQQLEIGFLPLEVRQKRTAT